MFMTQIVWVSVSDKAPSKEDEVDGCVYVADAQRKCAGRIGSDYVIPDGWPFWGRIPEDHRYA